MGLCITHCNVRLFLRLFWVFCQENKHIYLFRLEQDTERTPALMGSLCGNMVITYPHITAQLFPGDVIAVLDKYHSTFIAGNTQERITKGTGIFLQPHFKTFELWRVQLSVTLSGPCQFWSFFVALWCHKLFKVTYVPVLLQPDVLAISFTPPFHRACEASWFPQQVDPHLGVLSDPSLSPHCLPETFEAA